MALLVGQLGVIGVHFVKKAYTFAIGFLCGSLLKCENSRWPPQNMLSVTI